MINCYGKFPPAPLHQLQLGGHCPHCNTGTRFSQISIPDWNHIRRDNIQSVVVCYSCQVCLAPIPIQWSIVSWEDNNAVVSNLHLVIRSKEPFDFTHVPASIKTEIEEALDCLSVGAYNGFAALCRRCIQEICTVLGANATTRVRRQIEEMIQITELDDSWREIAMQIMLSGHDGSHPHLPNVESNRASVLLSLLRDLTYQLFTRPGKIKESATLRQDAIDKPSDE